MTYSSREEAGRILGQRLAEMEVRPDVVLGLPRGGVVVAAQVADILERPLDVLVVRKIGHPRHREFAIGALAEPDIVILDQAELKENSPDRTRLDEVIAEETERLRSYQTRFRPAGELALSGKTVLIVDDGLATGATAEAAVLSARKQKAREVRVAAPVASTNAIERLSTIADQVIPLVVDPDFVAVGQYYDFFPQTTDEEVVDLLHGAEY